MPPMNRRPQDQRSQGGRDHGRSSSQVGGPSMPTPRPVQYFTPEGHVRPDLLDKEADGIASSLRDFKSSQMRRFYDDAKAIERRILLAGEEQKQEQTFESQRAMLAMLKANVAYGFGRSDKIIPREFLQFIVDHVAVIRNLKDFRAFLKHFEAVVAFHKFYSKD